MSFMDSKHQPQKTVKNIAHRKPLRTDLPQFKNNLNKDAKKSKKMNCTIIGPKNFKPFHLEFRPSRQLQQTKNLNN